jgi:hypothetical protein
MSFDAARNSISPSRRAILDSLLAEWRSTSDLPALAAENLRAEKGSQINKIATYVSALVDNEKELRPSSPTIGMTFEQTGAGFAFAGHEASPFAMALFGRAITLVKFARFLAPQLDVLGCFDTEEDIRGILRSLDNVVEASAPTRFRVYFEAIRNTPLGKKAVFATFIKPVSVGASPWTPPVPRAEEIRSSIALGEDLPGEDYLLFSYHLPSGVLPQVPTTASPGWFYQRWFRPNPSADTDLHGWTAPLDPSFAKRPEIVHPEVNGRTLVFPLHLARA